MKDDYKTDNAFSVYDDIDSEISMINMERGIASGDFRAPMGSDAINDLLGI